MRKGTVPEGLIALETLTKGGPLGGGALSDLEEFTKAGG
jgi:hypothetical protein